MERGLAILFFILINNINGLSQNGNDLRLINLLSLSGEVNLSSSYRQQERYIRSVKDHSDHLFLLSGLKFNSKTAIWHPNFLKLDINAEIQPSTKQENFIVIPDQSEVVTSSAFDVRATLFSGKAMNMTAFGGLNESYIKREFLTDVRSNLKFWGVDYHYGNRLLPFSVSYNIRESHNEEIELARQFESISNDFHFNASKSFTKNDFSDFSFTRMLYRQSNGISGSFENTSTNLNFTNTIFFDSQKKYMLRSTLSNTEFQGNLMMNRLMTRGETVLKLPSKFTFSGNYVHHNTQQENQFIKQHNAYGQIEHQLYESLHTSIYGQYSLNSRSLQEVTQNIGGVKLSYTKRIPVGILTLAYGYRGQHLVGESKLGSLNFLNEEHNLTDGVLILLDRPFVDENSVVVKDINGIIIYRINLDYRLIPQANFLEIQRVPGGQIPNSTSVLIDYMSIQPGNYQYDGIQTSVSVNLNLFDRKVDLYYSKSWQDFKNVELAEFLTLDNYERNIVGGKILLNSFSTGVEYQDFKSVLVPLRQMRYYASWNGNIAGKWMMNLNSEISNYHFVENDQERVYISLSENLIYQIDSRSRISLGGSYQKQNGKAIDLNLYSGKMEYEKFHRQLRLVAGVEYFNRDYIGAATEFWGVYFRLKRLFRVK